MRTNDLDAQIKLRPFVPLRIHFSDGSHYDIRHPEMITVSRTVISLAICGRADATMPERIVLCDPLHVTRLEPIDGEDRPS